MLARHVDISDLCRWSSTIFSGAGQCILELADIAVRHLDGYLSPLVDQFILPLFNTTDKPSERSSHKHSIAEFHTE